MSTAQGYAPSLGLNPHAGVVSVAISVHIATRWCTGQKNFHVQNYNSDVSLQFTCDKGTFRVGPGAKWEHPYINKDTAVRTMKGLAITEVWQGARQLFGNDITVVTHGKGHMPALAVQSKAQGGIVPTILSVYIETRWYTGQEILFVKNHSSNVTLSFLCDKGMTRLAPGQAWEHPYLSGATAINTMDGLSIVEVWHGDRPLFATHVKLVMQSNDVSSSAREGKKLDVFGKEFPQKLAKSLEALTDPSKAEELGDKVDTAADVFDFASQFC